MIVEQQSFRGSDLDTDHFSVLAKVKEKIEIEDRNRNKAEARICFSGE